jgi:penicillin-binding protein 1C
VTTAATTTTTTTAMFARPKKAARALAVVVASCFAASLAFIAWPLPQSLLDRAKSSSLVIVDAAGAPLSTGMNGDGARSLPLANDDIPDAVKAAFISAEDRRFYQHGAVDVRAIARAVRDSIAAGHVASGASTITQQLARLLVPRPRTIVGKAREALWALRLSAHVDKERVLLEYLNRVPLGNGTVGVEAASARYFDEPARALSFAQAAMLAGLAHAPAREDPLRFPDRALHRRNVVLARMHDAGYVDDDAFARATAEPLDLSPSLRTRRAPHFVEAVRESLASRGLSEAVRIETSIDPALQSEVERIVADELSGPLRAMNVGNAAVVVVDNASGRILAWVGSRDFFDEASAGQNDGVRALRQPGSALKPFVYGLALQNHVVTPATLLPDVETTLATESGTYAPRNYDKRVHGPVRVRAALQNSYNIPAVHLAEMLGPAKIVDELRLAGFDALTDSPEHYGVGVVLGDGDVTLYQMARAYSGLARGGVLLPLVDVVSATDGAGDSLAITAAFKPRRFLSRDAAALLTDILSDTGARSPAFGLDNALDLPFPVAAKTGTSRAYVDNWTAGFTKERTVAVWAGNFDGSAMHHVSGITGAGSIFRRVMMAVMHDVAKPAPLVDDDVKLETARICPLSGLRAGPSCPGAFEEHFLAGTAPPVSASCASHHLVASLDYAARDPCAREHRRTRALALEPRYAPWARGEGHNLVDGAVVCDAIESKLTAQRARLLSPVDGDELVIEPGVPSGQAIPIKARVDDRNARVEFAVDGSPRRPLRAPYSAWLDTTAGVHDVALYVDGAEVDRARLVVH